MQVERLSQIIEPTHEFFIIAEKRKKNHEGTWDIDLTWKDAIEERVQV